MHETQVACFPLSADQENDADVWGIMGASLSLNMSNIPFNTLLAGVRIGRIQGNWVLNPTFQQLEYSDLDIVVAGTEDALLMVEGGAVEVPEEDILEGPDVAHRESRNSSRSRRRSWLTTASRRWSGLRFSRTRS